MVEDKQLRKVAITEGKNLVLLDDILYHIHHSSAFHKSGPWLQVVVPVALRSEALQLAHDNLLGGGHQAMARTYAKIMEHWWWPNVYLDTHHYTESCSTCKRAQKTKTGTQGPLQSISASEPFEVMGMDFLGPLPSTSKGNRWMLVITDYHTKWAFVIPMKETTSIAVTEALCRNVVLLFRTPKRIITDRGSNFNSELINEVYRLIGIAKSTTTAYHPQTDGQTERFNAKH